MADNSKLKSLLNKINWLFKSFEENNFENVSALEKALLKEKVLMFYDEIENLKTKVRTENVELENIKIKETSIIPEPKNEIEKIIEKKEEVVKELEPKAVKEVETKPIAKVEPVIAKVEKPVEVRKVEPTPTVANEEQKEEKFAKSEAFSKQISKPKRDMREIIDLNKSFIFKAELFQQNNDLYNQFINEMNLTRTEDDAFSVMINWTEKLNWKTEENKAYDLLLRSVEKRFLPLI